MATKILKSRKRAAERVDSLTETAHAIRKAFDAMPPVEQQEGRAMLRRVAIKAEQRRVGAAR